MSVDVIEKIQSIIAEAPHASQSLLFFGLAKTLDVKKGGYMYLLIKLKEMTPENRQLAYELIELVISESIPEQQWQAFIDTIEQTIREAD